MLGVIGGGLGFETLIAICRPLFLSLHLFVLLTCKPLQVIVRQSVEKAEFQGSSVGKILNLLFNHCESDEEGVRNVTLLLNVWAIGTY